MKTLCLALALCIFGLAQAAAVAPQGVDLSMSEMMFMPMSLDFKAGQKVTIKLSNTGKVDHELQIYTKPKVAPKDEAGWDAYMAKNTLWLASKDTSLTVNGKAVKGKFFEVMLKPSQKAVLSFTPAKAGNQEMACHKPGHFEGGMKGAVNVK